LRGESGARVKKLRWHSTFGEIGVEEPQFRAGSQRIRPFASRAKVRHRGCSRPLQRVVTDLAADVPFAQAIDKLVEHHGVLLSESTIRRMTEGPAQQRLETRELCQGWPQQPGCAVGVAEMDGGRVPIMTPDTTREDRRKGKSLSWKEAKICLAHAQGSRTLSYGGTLQGDVGTAGRALFDCARRAGFGQATRLHAVGDGAEWIAGQIEEQFGAQSRYLFDFYHVCEYVSDRRIGATS